jgi:hypothetical protein
MPYHVENAIIEVNTGFHEIRLIPNIGLEEKSKQGELPVSYNIQNEF